MKLQKFKKMCRAKIVSGVYSLTNFIDEIRIQTQ